METNELNTIKCPNCGENVLENFGFCPKCGTKLTTESIANSASNVTQADSISDIKAKLSHIDIASKKKLIVAIIAVVVVIIVGSCISSSVKTGKALSTLEDYIVEERYDRAIQHINMNYDNEDFLKKSEKKIIKLYNGHIKDDEIDKAASIFNGIISQTYHVSLEKTDEVVENALKEIEKIKVSLEKGKIDFKDAKVMLEGYQAFEHTEINETATAALEKIEKINNSTIGFNDGNKYYKSKDYGKAIISYNMVDVEDRNYEAAQAKIEEIKHIYKSDVFSRLDAMLNANKYEEALEELNTLLEIGEDAEVSAKIDFVKAAQKKYMKEQAKKDQLVVVTDVRVFRANRYSNSMAAEVIIKNNSDKVVKNANIVVASFDSNGYAVNIEYPTLYGAEYDHMLRGGMSTINLLPGESYGKNRYYDSFDNTATKAHAIVKSVDFVDGSTWENPYYEYWVEECKDHY